MAASIEKHVFNFNVGILGHVDSGKTSLSKALSTVASTACFDKNPQSKERGITLDLGFSSFCVDVPNHLQDLAKLYDKIQFTLVDCPGHASLIRTIIGGAQIIDLMLLVVDVTKGMQTQTAECLIIGEITCQKMIVILNKVDLLPTDKRTVLIEKMKKKMLKTLDGTRFANCPVVAVAAKPGGLESADGDGIVEMIDTLRSSTYMPERNASGPFTFAVDHCFSIKGQGTVITGTVLNGSVAVNDVIEIPSINGSKKVKSIQMFRKPVDRVIQGDRAGVCVTQFDPKDLERGLVCSPGALPTFHAGIVHVSKISYFKGNICSKAKFHITISHETLMGRLTFFGLYKSSDSDMLTADRKSFDFTQEYVYQDELLSKSKPTGAESQDSPFPLEQFVLIEFEKPVTCPDRCLVIGSKLDTDIHTNTCRIAFHGTLLEGIADVKYLETILPKVKVYKNKLKEGQVERVQDEYTVIGKNLFKKETNLQLFTGLKVSLSTGEQGIIEGGFGQSGKIRIRIQNGLQAATAQRFAGTKKKSKGKVTKDETSHEACDKDQEPIRIHMTFRRYIFDPEKKIRQ